MHSMPLTIVMYHYVRDLERTRFPRIKARRTADFRRQIEYIRRHFEVVSGRDVVAAVRDGAALPANAALLTFDDGYADHYTDAFPILQDAGLTGCFFPVAGCVYEHRVLDVNKIQFVLAAAREPGLIVRAICDFIDQRGGEYGLPPSRHFVERFQNRHRWDAWDAAFVKRMLQRDLPRAVRENLIQELFKDFVSSDEVSFSHELYMSRGQLSELAEAGNTIGCHGYAHVWMNDLTPEEQARDLDAAMPLLRELAVEPNGWMMCYPHGGYNDSLIEQLQQRGCQVGLAVEVGVADLARNDPFRLPRLNTNDLPVEADAPAPLIQFR